ncbi:Uncharacterised protein [Vibrio cholerae]|nr:Uncharacterised protein [Vibrio cholerae]
MITPSYSLTLWILTRLMVTAVMSQVMRRHWSISISVYLKFWS